jgi:hypothetical protein
MSLGQFLRLAPSLNNYLAHYVLIPWVKETQEKVEIRLCHAISIDAQMPMINIKVARHKVTNTFVEGV